MDKTNEKHFGLLLAGARHEAGRAFAQLQLAA